MVEWVIDSNRPMFTVEDKKLIEAVEILDPKIKMPSRNMVTSDIKVMY